MRPAKFRRLRKLKKLEAEIDTTRGIIFKIGPYEEYTSIQEAIDVIPSNLYRTNGITITCRIPYSREVVTIERGFNN